MTNKPKEQAMREAFKQYQGTDVDFDNIDDDTAADFLAWQAAWQASRAAMGERRGYERGLREAKAALNKIDPYSVGVSVIQDLINRGSKT